MQTSLFHRLEGLGKIFKISIELHGKSSLEKEVLIDTTVQGKNITYPTDVKPHKKIIDKCVKTANKEDLRQRQSYKHISKQLVIDQRGNRNKNVKAHKIFEFGFQSIDYINKE